MAATLGIAAIQALTRQASLLVTTLVASLTKQFTMLLLAHALAALLDDRAHLSLRSLNSKGKSLQLAQYYTASGTNTRAGIHMVENHVSFSA